MSTFSFNVCPYCFENKDRTCLNATLQDWMPQNYCYVVCAMDGLSATLHVNVTTAAEVEIWLSEFHRQSQMTFRVERNRMGANPKENLFNCEYRCMHKTRSIDTSRTKPASRNTGCTATMKLLLKKTTCRRNGGGNPRKSRSSNPHIPSYPFRVILNLNHNHPITAVDILRHRDVGPEAREKITHLLRMNHSPSAALRILKFDLQAEHPDDYIVYTGDRYHCPDPQWCYRLYYKMFGAAVTSVQASHVEMEQDNDVQETTFQDDTLCADLERFDALCSRIKVMCGQDKQSFGPALVSFCMQGESLLSTPSAMITALHTFGKYSGAAAALNGKRRNIASRKRIGVQPTAVAHCKMAVVSRKRIHLGRPRKSSMVPEH